MFGGAQQWIADESLEGTAIEITLKPVEVEIINQSGSDVKLFSFDQASIESEEGILHNE